MNKEIVKNTMEQVADTYIEKTVENAAGAHLPEMRKATQKKAMYPIAFFLVAVGQQFQYRSTKAVKADKTHAVLIPSGKYVTIDKMKIVKVRG